MAKKYRNSNKPFMSESGMGSWTVYSKDREINYNRKNTGKGRVNKKKVLQLRYLQNNTIKPVIKDVLKFIEEHNIT